MRHRRCGVVLFGLAIVAAIAWPPRALAGGQAGAPATDAVSRVELQPVPEWLAWRVFHSSLAFYRGRSEAALETMLRERLGLGPGEAAVLYSAGARYLATEDRLEAEARLALQARFGTTLPAPLAALRPGDAPPPGAVMRLEPGKTLLEMAKERGVYDLAEQRKQAALAAHLSELTAVLGAPAVSRLSAFVQSDVAPHVRRGTVPAETPDEIVRARAARTPTPAGASPRPEGR
jgi:hypothetical protein